ncbi:MAG: DUF4114 domain-containing protein [Cyanobacteria bacterium P01_G01_bin.39]
MATVAVEKKQFIIDASVHNSHESRLKIDIPQIETGDLLIVKVLSGNAFGVYEGTHKLSTFYYQSINSSDSEKSFNSNFDLDRYEFQFASLVGSLDDGKTFFPIGNHLELTVLQPDGNLSLAFWGNDDSTADNCVTLTVEVQSQKDLEQFNVPVEVSNYIFTDRWQFDIDAKANSVSRRDLSPLLKTGLCLQPGDLITVDVHSLDFWSLVAGDASWNFNADGRKLDGTYWTNIFRFNHNFQSGSLVGTLDGGKTFFQVGTHLQMSVLNAGHLSFACWADDNYGDNQGVIRAYVKVVRDGITITQPSNVSSNSIDLGRFTNLSELKPKVKFDPNTCIWAKANCKLEPRPILEPRSIIDKGSAVIKTEPDKKYNLQFTVTPGSTIYKNTFGIFPVSADGSVAGVKPGDPTYAQTAVSNRVKLANYNEEPVLKGQKQKFESQLLGGTNYEIFLIVSGTPDQFLEKNPTNKPRMSPQAYFKTTAANPDGKSHVKASSEDEDTFGFEDMYNGGDKDFNDMLVEVKVTSVEDAATSSTSSENSDTTLTEQDCPLYPLCKLSQLNN